ncbi:MAG: hypothetical protein KIT84_30745 [Labilithrix sp.]|nr:hypothetical protein [Labilithrix sp.]MCW5815446.1 hypothetical protein [Labilithrix sp.]
MRTALVLLFGALAACSFSTSSNAPAPAAPPPNGACMNGPPMCSPDRRAVIQCQGGAWRMLQACGGAQGCAVVANMIRCDSNAAPPAAGPCAEGGYDCAPDRRSLLVCRGGRQVIASTCRGARGCTVASAVDCDHSIAALGDPCESTTEIACATDGKQLLRCAGGTYQLGELCPNACLSTSGRVLCQ